MHSIGAYVDWLVCMFTMRYDRRLQCMHSVWSIRMNGGWYASRENHSKPSINDRYTHIIHRLFPCSYARYNAPYTAHNKRAVHTHHYTNDSSITSAIEGSTGIVSYRYFRILRGMEQGGSYGHQANRTICVKNPCFLHRLSTATTNAVLHNQFAIAIQVICTLVRTFIP